VLEIGAGELYRTNRRWLKDEELVYRPRFIGHSVAHIQAAFSTGLQAILLAWAGVR